MAQVNGNELTKLLKATQRKQNINGKPISQVVSCVLVVGKNTLSTTSLVRDGKTSLSHFSIPCESSGPAGIPVPDIDRLLGVLKYHGNTVSLEHDQKQDKLRIVSGKKQTTLKTNMGALAYPNSRDTISDWADKSEKLAKKITPQGYVMGDGTTQKPMFTIMLNGTDLFEALRCDAMNGQKLNRYTFSVESKNLMLSVGSELKGATESFLGSVDVDDWSWSFEGGLDNVVADITETVCLHFYDFREHNQGIRMVLWLNHGKSWVYQAGVVA
tara:strand:+ start:30731 stop:31543 length:813 start_codon:yes stop_codon:yes gene_type:complete